MAYHPVGWYVEDKGWSLESIEHPQRLTIIQLVALDGLLELYG